jgi:hypothetical protein
LLFFSSRLDPVPSLPIPFNLPLVFCAPHASTADIARALLAAARKASFFFFFSPPNTSFAYSLALICFRFCSRRFIPFSLPNFLLALVEKVEGTKKEEREVILELFSEKWLQGLPYKGRTLVLEH